MLDQLEQRVLRPVDVLEEEDERLHVGEGDHDLARRPGDLLRAALPFERLEHAGGQTEHVGDGLLLAALAELRERLLERVVVGDARGRLDHLRQWPVGDALAVREASAAQDARALEPVDELPREAALPDAGLAEDREQMCTTVADRARERVLEQLELRFAPDERRAWACRPRGAVHRVHHAPRAKCRPHPLQLEWPRILDDEARGCKPVRGRPDQDLSRSRDLLEASREVHGLACGERGVRVLDDELAGLDADPRLEPELFDGMPDPERCAGGALCVVLVRLRNAKSGKHRVARELLDDPPVQRDAVRDLLEELVHATPDDLRIRAGNEARGVHQVHEQHCRELALHDLSVETTPDRR